MAADHRAGRLQPPRALRHDLRRCGRREAPPLHGAPRPVRLHRAVLLGDGRVVQRRLPDLARTAAGQRRARRRRVRRLRGRGRRGAAFPRPARGGGRLGRHPGQQDPRLQDLEDALHPGGRRLRGRAAHRRRQPVRGRPPQRRAARRLPDRGRRRGGPGSSGRAARRLTSVTRGPTVSSAYGDAHAAWYDALYAALGKDHHAEGEQLLALVTDELGRTPSTWLDVACGTGQHLAAVAEQVDEVVGVDLSAPMLDVARARLGGRVELLEADQRELDLGRRFDVVTSLFSSVGYVRDVEEFDRTIASLARHVAPGGLLVVEPWVHPDDWEDGRTQVVDVEETGGRAVRVLTSRREGQVSVLDVAVVTAADGRLTVDREEHRMLLVDPDRELAAFERAGLTTTRVDGPLRRGLVLGRPGASA
ncbi:class I SAM-dependent methyltransferase [Nitriliruptoraceae bacterium ZYF776]|nr:class I SAM-dependent methyltransferase [Profundirhabdus halotolerans]